MKLKNIDAAKSAGALLRFIVKFTPDCVGIGGCVSLSYGAFIYNESVGFIVAGSLAIAFAFLLDRNNI